MFATSTGPCPTSTGPSRPDATIREPRHRIVAQGDGYTVHECARHRGMRPTRPRPVVPVAMRVVIATSGLFRFGAQSRRALLTPGAMMIGQDVCESDLEPFDDGEGTTLTFEYSEAFVGAAFVSMRAPPHASPRASIEPASKRTARVFSLTVQLAREPRAVDVEGVAVAVLEAASIASNRASAEEGVAPELEIRIARTLRHVEFNHADDCSLEALAAEAGLGVFHFLRSFKRCVGQTPCQHVMAVRLREAAGLLASSQARVLDIAIQSGFSDLSHFNASFRETFGVQPSVYRKTHRLERMAA